jgi:hypothetical protein
MRRSLIGCVAALSVFSAGAAFAGNVYVPVPDPLGSSGSSHLLQVWITNGGTAQKGYSLYYMEDDTDGTKRPPLPSTATQVTAGRTTRIGGVGAPGKSALLEISADAALSIDARLTNTSPIGLTSMSSVPVISSDNMIAAGKTASLLGLFRDNSTGALSHLGIVNLGKQASSCSVKLLRADSSQIGGTVSLAFKPLSQRFFPDAFGLLGEQKTADSRIVVSCDQPFYAYGVLFTPFATQLSYVTPSASGASTLTGSNDSQNPPVTTPGSVVFTRPGTFHIARVGDEKETIQVTVPGALSLKRLVLEMDFVPGPWNPAKNPGNHAIVWLYRDKFRSNTIANVNAFSGKNTIKSAQNVNLPPLNTTQDEAGVPWVQGQRYHLKYTYDAEGGLVTVVLSTNGASLRTLTYPSTAPNRVLTVPATGLTAEFGHYANQEGPEVASYNWSYADLRVEMVPYTN